MVSADTALMSDVKKSRVVVVSCNSYDEEKVYNAIKIGLAALGGIEKFVSVSERILVKPNFLCAADAEKCITTHPAVIKAFLKFLQDKGYIRVMVGDSPASDSCEQALRALGVKPELYGARIAHMDKEERVDFPEGRIARRFYFAKDVIEADAIVGLCKMKTHALERITGAVKNMYGLICGRRKKAGHVLYPDAMRFAKMLADIHSCIKPRLHIMDGIIAMEGNGPSSGDPIYMGVMLFSVDPVALDSVFCRLINLNPILVPTNTKGAVAGIGHFKTDEIEIVLADVESSKPVSPAELFDIFGKADFKVQREADKFSILSLWSRINAPNRRKPVIDEEKCVCCGVCVEHCPVEGKAVSFEPGKSCVPVFDYKKCIRCFCCQELCPEHAISVR
jgi:uncharacterized protein (DUF362 family)/ferredoxin